jgi:PPIC-type peptidyl-prolyl cis-trans isomerase-like protein
MRRWGVVLMVLAVAGCDALRDAFSARAEVVARVGDQTLGVEKVAQWVAGAKQVPLQPEAVSRLAHVYVDYTLFAGQLADGHALDDSATILAAMWPIVSQMKWERYHDKLVANRGQLTPAQVDSAFNANGARLFQHILLSVPQSAAPPVIAQKQRQIDDLARQLRAGARFGPLAARWSDDPGSKVQNGMLPVSEPGAYVQPFEEAAWALAPGATSGVVRSPFGFHIIRRPPLAEVRDSFRVGLEARIAQRFDSLYLEDLAKRRAIKVVGSAGATVRQAAQDLDGARRSGTTLVRYQGGAFRVRDMVRWIQSLDPSVAQAIPGATDEQITQFLTVVTQRQLLLSESDSAGVQLTPEDWTFVKAQHDSAVAILQSVLNVTPQLFRDSTHTPAARDSLVATRVIDYLDRVLSNRERFVPIPPFFADVLRARADWSVSAAGVRTAVERAGELRAATDSLRAPSQGQPAPQLPTAPPSGQRP